MRRTTNYKELHVITAAFGQIGVMLQGLRRRDCTGGFLWFYKRASWIQGEADGYAPEWAAEIHEKAAPNPAS